MVSFRGDIALLSNVNISVPDAPWYLQKLWTHGHVGVVRSLLWDEEVGSVPSYLLSLSDIRFSFQNHTLVTGGEDGKINSWPIHPIESKELIDGKDADGDESMDVDMQRVCFFFFLESISSLTLSAL